MSAGFTVVPTSSANAAVASLEQTVSIPSVDGLLQKFVVHFDDIKFGRLTFKLTSPIELTLESVEGGWTCQEGELSLFGFGPTSVAAVLSVFEDFAVLWEEIAQAPDDALSADAIRLKGLLRSKVESFKVS
jgi:hypothetical protein